MNVPKQGYGMRCGLTMMVLKKPGQAETTVQHTVNSRHVQGSALNELILIAKSIFKPTFIKHNITGI